LTDAGLEHLAGLKLKSLNIPEPARTERGLKHYIAALDSPQQLDLSGWVVGDASMKLLTDLKQLEVLNLSKTKVTDAGLAEIAGITSLRELHLLDTAITDDGLKAISKLNLLRVLNLVGTQVTDAGLRHLAGWKLQSLLLPDKAKTDLGLKHFIDASAPLESLDLANWKLTDKGLGPIGSLTELKRLDLRNAPITDASMKQLANLKKLQWLHLGGADKITDAGVKYLAGLTELQSLNLSFCPRVTDTGMCYLTRLNKLTSLNVVRTGVSDRASLNLSGMLKDIRIVTDCMPLDKHRP
jgi:hypothetical protein